jgi:hypothetical protein
MVCVAAKDSAPDGVDAWGCNLVHPTDEAVRVATLDGGAAARPNASPASGTMTMALRNNTDVIFWHLCVDDLRGTLTQAQIDHRASGTGIHNITADLDQVGDAMCGTGLWTLSPDQVDQFLADGLSVRIRTNRYPNGEVRGQITAP